MALKSRTHYRSSAEKEILRRLVFDEAKLHDVLFGRWAEWGGRRPPSSFRQRLIQALPKGTVKHIPSCYFLDVSTVSSLQVGVFSAVAFEEYVVIGRLPGRRESTLTAEDAENSWEILNEDGGIKNYLCMENHHRNSWMKLIQCARYAQEQNLELVQKGSGIFYKTIKEIQSGEELLVWYGVKIPQYLGIPLFETDMETQALDEKDFLTTLDRDKKKATCVLCNKGFNSRSNLRSHMRIHTQQKPFKCSTCGRCFSQSSTLRNHTRLHTGEKPYKCNMCHNAYSQLAGLRAHQKSSQHQPCKK